jgi:DNA-binding XRE family transcriptional regulator
MRKKWEDRDYLTISEVSVLNDKMQIEFRNGHRVELAVSALAPLGLGSVDWKQVYVSDDRLHINVPAAPQEFVIPWHRVRCLTDKEFARHMAECASNQAKYVGVRLRELRKRRHLTQAQVAERAAIEPGNLSRIENGHFDISTSTLWKILQVMGYSAADLAPTEEAIVAEMECATP